MHVAGTLVLRKRGLFANQLNTTMATPKRKATKKLKVAQIRSMAKTLELENGTHLKDEKQLTVFPERQSL